MQIFLPVLLYFMRIFWATNLEVVRNRSKLILPVIRTGIWHVKNHPFSHCLNTFSEKKKNNNKNQQTNNWGQCPLFSITRYQYHYFQCYHQFSFPFKLYWACHYTCFNLYSFTHGLLYPIEGKRIPFHCCWRSHSALHLTTTLLCWNANCLEEIWKWDSLQNASSPTNSG